MGFGGGRGMRNDGYLNTLKVLLRKKKKNLEKAKQIISVTMEERSMNSRSW